MKNQSTYPSVSRPPDPNPEPQEKEAQQKDSRKEVVHKASPEWPFMLYDPKTGKGVSAKDQQEYDKLTGQGMVEDPPPPADPDYLTQDEVKTLQSLLAKAAKALEKLGHLSHEK